jgi:hypothetical protein
LAKIKKPSKVGFIPRKINPKGAKGKKEEDGMLLFPTWLK